MLLLNVLYNFTTVFCPYLVSNHELGKKSSSLSVKKTETDDCMGIVLLYRSTILMAHVVVDNLLYHSTE